MAMPVSGEEAPARHHDEEAVDVRRDAGKEVAVPSLLVVVDDAEAAVVGAEVWRTRGHH